jgi:hypothetical protein
MPNADAEPERGILVCFCSDYVGEGAGVTGHQPGKGLCMSSYFRAMDDSLREYSEGEVAPTEEVFVAGEPCGFPVMTGPNSWNEVTCERDPHQFSELHIAIADDQVEYIWREPLSFERDLLVLTSDGMVCRHCGILYTSKMEHYEGCSWVQKLPNRSDDDG